MNSSHCPRCRGSLVTRQGVVALVQQRVQRSSTGLRDLIHDALSRPEIVGLDSAIHQAGIAIPPDREQVVKLRPASVNTFAGWLSLCFSPVFLITYFAGWWSADTRLVHVLLLSSLFFLLALLILIHQYRASILLTPTGFVLQPALLPRCELRWDAVRDISLWWWGIIGLKIHGPAGERIRISWSWVGFIGFIEYLSPHATTEGARRAIDRLRRLLKGHAVQ